MKSKLIFATACALASAARVFAGTVTFEAAPVTQDAGSFYQGVNFSGDVVINASSAFPDASGGNHVLQGTGSDIILNFTSAQSSVSFYYSTFFTLTATAYGPGNTVLATFTGNQNTDALNTGIASLATLTASGITKVDINGQFGDYYDIDNVTAPGVSGLPAVPDATGTLALLGVASVGLFAFRRKLAV